MRLTIPGFTALICALAATCSCAQRAATLPAGDDPNAVLDQLEGSNVLEVIRAVKRLGAGGLSSKHAIPALLSALDDEAPPLRWAACDALGRIGDTRRLVWRRLRARLEDEDVRVRVAAARALAALGATDLVLPTLVEALRHENAFVRAAAARALAALGSHARTAGPALLDLVRNDPEMAARCAAAGALGPIGVDVTPLLPLLEEAIAAGESGALGFLVTALLGKSAASLAPKLLTAFASGDPLPSGLAAIALIALGVDTDRAAAQLETALPEDEDLFGAAAQFLASAGSVELERFQHVLLVWLANPKSPARVQSAELLSERPTASAIQGLLNGLVCGDEPVEGACLESLARAGEDAVPLLRESLANSATTRAGIRAAEVLARLDDAAAMTWIVDGVSGRRATDLATRVLVIQAAGRVNGPQVVDPLATALAGGSVEVRVAAAEALATLDTSVEAAQPALERAVTDSDARVASAAQLARRRIEENRAPRGFGKTAAQWIEALRGPDQNMRRFASYGVSQLPPEAAVPILVDILRDEDPWMRNAAARALGAFGSPAKPAAAALANLLRDPATSLDAAVALLSIEAEHNDAVKAIDAALTSADAATRLAAVEAVGGSSKVLQPGPERPYDYALVKQVDSRALRAVSHRIVELARGDPDDGVRRAALEVAGTLPESAEALSQELARELGSKDPSVRARAARLMSAVASKTLIAIPPLVVALQDPAEEVRCEAAGTLLETTDVGRRLAVEVLEEVLASPDDKVHVLATRVVERSHRAGGWFPFQAIAWFETDDPGRRLAAVRGVGACAIKNPSLVGWLAERLVGEDEAVRLCASEVLRDLAARGSEDVRGQAQEALTKAPSSAPSSRGR